MTIKTLSTISVLAGGFFLALPAVRAVPYHYVDWLTASPSLGLASGVITLPDASTVDVDFEALNPDGSPGSFFFGQTSGGTDYWNPEAPFISAEVWNSPTGTDIIALIGGTSQTYKVTLSEAIKDPIMAILSLGQPSVFTSYRFDSPFEIVSQGPGYWGGTTVSLVQLPGNVLVGNEGHGTLKFDGTFSTFSWTVPTPENWHGFTFGIRTTERIEPTPVPEGGATVALLGLTIALAAALRMRISRSLRP